jgi:L-ascorbate metabolism protein UlaG (beta-lactamase superfamily)
VPPPRRLNEGLPDLKIRAPRITCIGGPTALLEWGGLCLLTDPTFDPSGTIYSTGAYSLRKNQEPALPPDALPALDAVLLSHDHHFDNLDHSGRDLLPQAARILTTPAGASRLGKGAVGLVPWQEMDLSTPDGRVLRVTATPGRHGPAHADRGPVTGFILTFLDDPAMTLYISGDSVWYEGVREVSARFSVQAALLFMGAARVPAVGPWHLTFTVDEGGWRQRVRSREPRLSPCIMKAGSTFQNLGPRSIEPSQRLGTSIVFSG